MTEHTYSLSELSRLCGRSKSTLQQMIAQGELQADSSSEGRRSWSIRRSDAIEAGLVFRIDNSIDAALQVLLQEQIGPLVARLDLLDEGLRQRLERIQEEFERAAVPSAPRTTWTISRALRTFGRRWGLGVTRP